MKRLSLNTKIDESFTDVFDSSLTDYSEGFEKSDERYLKEEAIHEWLSEHNSWIDDPSMYDINDDFSIDVHGDVILITLDGTLPDYIKFNNVYGNFTAESEGLKSFVNMPRYVEGDCDLSGNRDIFEECCSLEGIPENVGGELNLENIGWCESLSPEWDFHGHLESEDCYLENLDLLKELKAYLKSAGSVNLGAAECMPRAHINDYNETSINEMISELEEECDSKIWLSYLVEDDAWEDDEDWDENCTKWVQEHWPELNFSGVKEDDEDEDSDEMNESFDDAFDLNLTDYSNDFAAHDKRYMEEELKKKYGYMSQDEYDRLIEVFGDFLDMSKTTFEVKDKSEIEPKNSNQQSRCMCKARLFFSRKKFEEATGIKYSTLFYSSASYPYVYRDTWGSYEYDYSHKIRTVSDIVQIDVSREAIARPYFIVRKVAHDKDGKRVDGGSRAGVNKKFTLDMSIEHILKSLYKTYKPKPNERFKWEKMF